MAPLSLPLSLYIRTCICPDVSLYTCVYIYIYTLVIPADGRGWRDLKFKHLEPVEFAGFRVYRVWGGFKVSVV